VAGLDFGSAFSAVVITRNTDHRDSVAVAAYPGTPSTLYGSPSKVLQIPSQVRVSKTSSDWRFTIGYETLKLSGTIFTNLKATLAEKPNEAFNAKLTKLNRGSKVPLSSERLVKEFLQQLREHCENWCSSRDLLMPPATAASYPIAWSVETALKYQKVLEDAGWQNITLVNEAEAAADAIFVNNKDRFSDTQLEKMSLMDLGGLSFVSFLSSFSSSSSSPVSVSEAITNLSRTLFFTKFRRRVIYW
jgi:hypothetical protein